MDVLLPFSTTDFIFFIVCLFVAVLGLRGCMRLSLAAVLRLFPVMACLCQPRMESLLPPRLWRSCSQMPLDFQVIFPRDSQSLGLIPRLGSLMWGLEPSQQWENFFDIIVPQFVGGPPGEYRI